MTRSETNNRTGPDGKGNGSYEKEVYGRNEWESEGSPKMSGVETSKRLMRQVGTVKDNGKGRK